MENDEIEKILDEALTRYSSVEPLAGLDQRILNRVRESGARPRHILWPWILAGSSAVVAGLLVAAILWTKPVPTPAPVVLAHAVPAITFVAPPRPQPDLLAGLPKRREFPTPAPITAEERALLTLAAQAPNQTLEAFRDLEHQGGKPLQLNEIKIEPLHTDGL